MTDPFHYYPGQVEYLARVAVKDAAYVVADTGCGKSLFMISLARMKLEDATGQFRGRALFVVPGGTLRDQALDADEVTSGEDIEAEDSPESQLSQWRQELSRFAPQVPIYSLTHWADYQRLLRPDGSAPPGIYISYYEAMFRNGARHSIPDGWGDQAHKKLCLELGVGVGDMDYAVLAHPEGGIQGVGRWFEPNEVSGRITGAPRKGDRFSFGGTWWLVADLSARPRFDFSEGVGMEQRGIRCVAKPCLSDEILMWAGAHGQAPWDFVALDEAHYCCNLGAQVTQSFIRVQAKHRFAFTATPIPNAVTNLCALMGWLCVPGWFRGGQRNAAWPYAREELGRFTQAFVSEERDFTEEEMRRGRSRSYKAVRTSPVISAPARLLKILKPTMAFISKPMCRPEYQPAELIDVRVPLGLAQASLYSYYLCRSRVPGKHPLVRARRQIAWLRGICADPAGFDHGGPSVPTNFNPKTVAALNLIREILGRKEQVVVVSARIGQTDTIAHRLREAEIPYARIDSTQSPEMHSAEANRFKAQQVPVLLMGIKCAASHSFHQCPNLIVLSLEYSYGSLHQARGRVDRVNSLRAARIYCLLHKDSIEEAMFDRVATKEDAARICLHGQRIPRDYKPVDAGEVLAEHLAHWETEESRSRRAIAALQGGHVPDHIEMRAEVDCEAEWPELCREITKAWKAWQKPRHQPAPVPTPFSAPVLEPQWVVASPPATPKRPAWLDRFRARSTSTTPVPATI